MAPQLSRNQQFSSPQMRELVWLAAVPFAALNQRMLWSKQGPVPAVPVWSGQGRLGRHWAAAHSSVLPAQLQEPPTPRGTLEVPEGENGARHRAGIPCDPIMGHRISCDPSGVTQDLLLSQGMTGSSVIPPHGAGAGSQELQCQEWGNGFRLKEGRFRWDMGQELFPMGV